MKKNGLSESTLKPIITNQIIKIFMRNITALKIAILIVIPALVATLILGCGGEQKNDTETTDTNVVANQQKQFSENEAFKIPSPIELFLYMRDYNAKFDQAMLNPTENYQKYLTTDSKALNFGTFASDLAYSTVFKESQKALLYSKVVKSLADEIGLTEGFNEAAIRRIQDNINNPDSLHRITTDAYWDAFTYLESQNKRDVLTYIIVGGWIESVHIAIGSVKKFSPSDKIVIRIAEQQLSLENILNHMQTVERTGRLEDINKALLDLQMLYDELLNNNPDVIITQDQFKKISEKIKLIRSEFIS